MSMFNNVLGTPELTVTGKRACLSLGALAKSLHEVNVTESDRIVERLENWLKPHNQSKCFPVKCVIIYCTLGQGHH